jgi:DNA-binding beta-propeller fold protein YncE
LLQILFLAGVTLAEHGWATFAKRRRAATLGTIPAGAFPREMAVSADGRTLFLTNFGSQSLQAIDIGNLPIVPERR